MSTDPTRDPARLKTPSGVSGDGAAPDAAAMAVGPTGEPRPPGFEGRVRSRRARWLRRAALALFGIVAFLALAVTALVLYLQSSGGRGQARSIVVGQIEKLLADDAEVSAEALEGNFLTGARLIGLRIVRDGETILTVDTVQVDYTLRTLLNQTFSADELIVAGPSLFVRQRADSTFNVTGLLKPAEDTTQGGAFTVLIEEMLLRRGRAEVRWYPPDADSVLVVSDIDAVVSNFASTPDSLVGAIAGLNLVATAPRDAARMALSGSGRFTKERLDLRELQIQSDAGTEVRGSALAVYGEAAGGAALPVFEADLEATPLAFSDIRAFTGASLYGDPRVRLRASSDGETLSLDLNAGLDDAALALDAELVRSAQGPVRTRAEGTLRNLDPGTITRNPALAGRLSGELSANLQGGSLQALSGPFSVLLRESRFGDQAIDRVRLDGSFAAGQVRFDLAGDVPGASLVAQGQARPFDDVPSFQVTGTAEELDLGRLLPESGQTARLAGEFALVGRGRSLDTFTGTAAVSLGEAAFAVGDNTVRLASADLDADIRSGAVDFDAAAALADGGGSLTATGGVLLGSDPLQYGVTQGTLTRLDVAAITGNPDQASDLTGTFTLDGAGLDPRTARIDLDASLQNSRFGTYDLVAVDLDATLQGGDLAFDTEADLGRAGVLAATGTAQPFADPLRYQAEGRMQNLDLAELLPPPDDPSQRPTSSDLTGTFSLTGRGIDPQTMTLDADLALDGSSYGDRYIDRANVDLALRGGTFSVTGDVAAPEGNLTLDLSGQLGDDLALDIGNTCFQRLDLGAFVDAGTGPSAFTTRLDGCFTGSLRGLSDLETADGTGTLTLGPSTVNDAEIERGRVAFTLSDGALGATYDLALADPTDAGTAGSLVGVVQARPFEDRPTYAARGTAQALDLGALLGAEDPARLSLDYSVSGDGLDPQTMTLDARLSGGSSILGPVAVDTLQLALALDGGVLAIDTLALDSDIADLTGSGTLALFNPTAASAFRLRGNVDDLAPLNAYTERTFGLRSGTLDLTASAEADSPVLVVNGLIEARQASVDLATPDEDPRIYAVSGLDATLFGQINRRSLDSLGIEAVAGRTQVEFDLLSTPQIRAERGAVELSFVEGEVRAEGGVTVDRRRDLDFAARFEIESDPRQVVIERGRFSVDADTWTLGQEATITLADPIDIRGLILTSDNGEQQIAADGTIDFNGEQSFVVTIEGVEIGTIADLFQYENLGGTLSADLVLTGPAFAPVVDGGLTLEDLASGGETFGDLAADIRYSDSRLGIDAVLTHVEGETLTVAGFVPLQFSLADSARTEAADAGEGVQLAARASAFPIAWAQPFLAERGYTDLGGTLALDLQITGTQGDPTLGGTARLTDGRLALVSTGTTYDPVQAAVRFQGDQILLDDVVARNGGGRIDIGGAVTLEELSLGTLDLTLRPDNFLALDTDVFSGLTLDRGSQPLRLSGTLQRPVLRGAVVVAAGDINTDQLVAVEYDDVALSPEQIREVEARFGRRITARDTAVNRFTDALDYNLTVEFNRNVWVRSASAATSYDIEFEGDVQAIKAPFAEESRLFGQIDLVRGTVETLNERFEIDRGTLTFNGPPLGADINLTATSDIRLAGASASAAQGTVTVILEVTGQFDENPAITLRSTPQLDPADIASLIATGQLASNAGVGSLGNFGQRLLAGAGFGAIEGAVSDRLGLDLVQIDYNADGNLVLRVGRYLGQRAFVTAGTIVPTGRNSSLREDDNRLVLGLEYQLLRWLLAEGEYGGERGVGGGVSTEIAW